MRLQSIDIIERFDKFLQAFVWQASNQIKMQVDIIIC